MPLPSHLRHLSVRTSELEAAAYAYRAAMARIANAGGFLAVLYWRERVAALQPGQAPQLAVQLAPIVWAARRMARQLTIAWYRYTRALDSGYTYGDSEHDSDDTLGGLRRDFEARLQDAAGLGHSYSSDPSTRHFERELMEADYESASDNPRSDALDRDLLDEEIQKWFDSQEGDESSENRRDDFQWPQDSTEEDIRRHIERYLRQEVSESARRRRQRLDDREEGSGRRAPEDKVIEQHDRVAQELAGELLRLIREAGDSTLRRALSRDRRVLSVARGTALRPCSFCAILASRGFVYNSIASASFHPHSNCQCYPIPRWTYVTDDDLPPLNKWFKELWGEVAEEGGTNREQRNRFRLLLNEHFGDRV